MKSLSLLLYQFNLVEGFILELSNGWAITYHLLLTQNGICVPLHSSIHSKREGSNLFSSTSLQYSCDYANEQHLEGGREEGSLFSGCS